MSQGTGTLNGVTGYDFDDPFLLGGPGAVKENPDRLRHILTEGPVPADRVEEWMSTLMDLFPDLTLSDASTVAHTYAPEGLPPAEATRWWLLDVSPMEVYQLKGSEYTPDSYEAFCTQVGFEPGEEVRTFETTVDFPAGGSPAATQSGPSPARIRGYVKAEVSLDEAVTQWESSPAAGEDVDAALAMIRAFNAPEAKTEIGPDDIISFG